MESTIILGYSGTEGATRAVVRAAGVVDPAGDINYKDRQLHRAVLLHGRKLAHQAPADIEAIAAGGDPADELLRIAGQRSSTSH